MYKVGVDKYCGYVYMWKNIYVGIAIHSWPNMKRRDIVLPDDLEEKFRKHVAKKMGLKKGNLSLAVKEAIEKWIENTK